MQYDNNQIAELTERVWNSFLGLDLSRSDEFGESGATFVTGCVQISGEWNGAVTLHCSEALARQATCIMFEIGEEEATFEEMQDAVGELTNMIGGNFKVLLPQPTQMSLPAVVEGSDYSLIVPGTHLQGTVAFKSTGHAMKVSVLEKT